MPEAEKVCCVVFVVAVTAIVLFVVSFHYVDELSYCLRYDVNTKVMADKVEDEPGTFFLGPSGGFKCFPRTRQQLEFSVRSESQEPRLAARTKEGLKLEMDIMIEYELQKDNIRALYDLAADEYGVMYQLLAGASLRNVANTFPAINFLDSTRRNISLAMKEALVSTFKPYYADVLSVQLFHVDLPDRYESWIKRIESSRLDQKKERAYRVVAIQNKMNEYTKAKIDLTTDAQKAKIEAQAKVDLAILKAPEAIVLAETEAMAALQQAYRIRNSTLVKLDGDLQVAYAEQLLAVLKAQNEQNRSKIEFERELLLAKNEAIVQNTNAAAEAYAIEQAAKAAAHGIEQMKSAQLQQLMDMSSAADLNRTELLQFVYMNVLKAANGAELYLDYKKVPLFMEGAPSST